MDFERHLTSCMYKISGFHYAFIKIDFSNELIHLDYGGINSIPVRLSDVEKIHVTGFGELTILNGRYEWIK